MRRGDNRGATPGIARLACDGWRDLDVWSTFWRYRSKAYHRLIRREARRQKRLARPGLEAVAATTYRDLHRQMDRTAAYTESVVGHAPVTMNALANKGAYAAAVFGQVDVLASPTVHTEVPLIDDNKDLLSATRDATRNTYAGAFGQIPGLSVPCGFSVGGLPVGLQLESAWWDEPLLLRVGHCYQQVTDWHLREPPLARGR